MINRGTLAGIGIVALIVGAACGGSGSSSAGTGAGGASSTSTTTTSTSTSISTGGQQCLPGAQLPCACPGEPAGGKMGVQVCASDGQSVGPCEGCGTGGAGGGSGGSGGAGGEGCGGVAPYPAGPYGLAKGMVLPDVELQGYVDASKDKSAIQIIKPDDFYNPAGNAVYPACSQYGGGKARPKALLVFIASVWTGPANQEAKTVVPAKYAKYAPLGGQFVSILVDGPTPGVDATFGNLTNWAIKYAINYPLTIEPAHSIDSQIQAYPLNLLVDTKTMKIVQVSEGVPADPGAFWSAFDALTAP